MKRRKGLKRGKGLKRSRLKKKSVRGQLLIDCDKAFRKVILGERPNVCECGCGKTKTLQVSHILPKGRYPRLRYCKSNIFLLAFPCHPERWHKDPCWANELCERKLGKNYRQNLLLLDKTMPRLTNMQINLYKLAFEQNEE